MGHRLHGRHRAPTKPISGLILPITIVSILPTVAVVGFLTVTPNAVTQLNSVDPNAGSITIAASPLDTLPALSLSAPSPAEIRGTDHTTLPNGSSYGPSESATESPVTTSTVPALPTTQEKDQQAPTASSEALPSSTAELQANPKCTNLNSDPKVVNTCNTIMALFPNIDSMIGKAVRAGNSKSCHHKGLALDVMVSSNALGDQVYKWALDNKNAHELGWLGWEVKNHYDHVHISFLPCKG